NRAETPTATERSILPGDEIVVEKLPKLGQWQCRVPPTTLTPEPLTFRNLLMQGPQQYWIASAFITGCDVTATLLRMQGSIVGSKVDVSILYADLWLAFSGCSLKVINCRGPGLIWSDDRTEALRSLNLIEGCVFQIAAPFDCWEWAAGP